MSHTDSKRLFVLKAGVAGHLCVRRNLLITVKFLDFRLFTTASYKSEVLQAKEDSTEFPQTDG